jgi:2-polyprenyl-3-methyl-5-hydroxy-6-metoxy-1,4-benzoquinol methylase
MEKVKCALCNLDDYKVMLKVKDYRYHIADDEFNLVQCKNCGLIYVNPRPTKEEISKFYPEEYYRSKVAPLVKIINRFLKLPPIRSVRKYRKQGRLLDLGCGTGNFLWEMKKRGFEVHGIDSSSQACKLARERLKNIFNAELEKHPFPDNYFDVITVWHVLEHLPNPNITLKEIRRILKKDGILILETPNIDSLSFKTFRKNCFHLDIPRHFYHWSSKTIREILKRNKFRVFKISYFSLGSPLGLFHSFSNLLNDYKIKSPLCPLVLIITSPLLFILTIFFCILPFKGDVLRVYAEIEI